MEGNWEPFEVVEDAKGKTLRLHGTKDKRKTVKEEDTPKILEAIENGWDVDIYYAAILGGIDLSQLALDENQEGYASPQSQDQKLAKLRWIINPLNL